MPQRLAARITGVRWVPALLGVAVATVMAETQPPPDAERHWAFQPPRDVTVPEVRDRAWPVTAVDRFILAKLEAAGLAPAAPADPRTLLRRISMDLTGLPPTEEQVRRFSAAAEQDRPAAVSQVI